MSQKEDHTLNILVCYCIRRIHKRKSKIKTNDSNKLNCVQKDVTPGIETNALHYFSMCKVLNNLFIQRKKKNVGWALL